MGCAPCSSIFGVSRNRSPETHAVAMYEPFASIQKYATNQIHFVRMTNAIATGIITPRIGPPQSVTSGYGSGSKKLYGRCQGSRSASVKVPPHTHPQITWPNSCETVMTHQDTTRSATNFSVRFAIRAASSGVVVCEDLYQTRSLPSGLVPMDATIVSYLGSNPLIATRVHP